MPVLFLYLFNAVIVATVLVYFVVEAFGRLRTVRRNLVFLAVITLALLVLVIPFWKMFFGGVGQWGISRSVGMILTMVEAFLFFSILLLKLIWLSVGLRTVWLVWKQRRKQHPL